MGVRGCRGVRPRTWWLRTTQLILRQAGSRKSGVASLVQVPAGLASPGGSGGTVSLYLPAAEVSALLASWPRTTWPLLSLRPHRAAVCLSCSQTPLGLPFIRLTSHIRILSPLGTRPLPCEVTYPTYPQCRDWDVGVVPGYYPADHSDIMNPRRKIDSILFLSTDKDCRWPEKDLETQESWPVLPVM